MYKTLKELLARDANGRLTLLNPLEPFNAEPTNRGTRAIATSVDKLLSARTSDHSFRVQSASSSVSWDNATSTLSVSGELYLECAFPVSGDEIEVFPYNILLSGNYSVLAYRVLILPEEPTSFTLVNGSPNLLNFSSIADLIEGFTALSGDEQARAVLIAVKHSSSIWLAPGMVIADGATITNFGTDSQYAIQNDFLTLENYVRERDHLVLYDGNEQNLVAYTNIGPAGTITIRNFDNYYVKGVLKSNKTINIVIPDLTSISPGEILYVIYPNMDDDETEVVTVTTGTFADAGSAEKYIVLMAPGNDIALPVSGGQLTFGTKTSLPFTICGRLLPTPINYEASTVALVRGGNYGGPTPPSSPHTAASFPRLVKSGGSAQSAYTDTGVEAHKVVCGDLSVYGTPKSGETGGSFPYPPTGSNYKVAIVSSANGTSTPGIETSSIFVDGIIWADEIALGSTPAERIGVRGSIVLQADLIYDTQVAVASLDTRMDTAEGEIDTLQTEMSAAEANITTLQSDVATAQDTADDAQLWAYAARFFGSAMDIKYSGTVNSGVGATPDNSIFRIRPVLACRVGEKIGTFQAGAVRGLSSDGIRLHVLERYSNTTNRLRSVTMNASNFTGLGSTNWFAINLGSNRAFLESSGSSVYGFESANEIIGRFATITVAQIETRPVTTYSFTADSITLCGKYLACWYVDTVDDRIQALIVGSTTNSTVHTPQTFTSVVVQNTDLIVGDGQVFCSVSFANICAVVYRDQADDDETKVTQFRIDSDDRTLTQGPTAIILTSNTLYARSCTDGEFFFVVAPTVSGGTGLSMSVFPIAGPSDESRDFTSSTSSSPVFNHTFLSSVYLGIDAVQQVFADGNTCYVVCSEAVYAFKYNGSPAAMSYCWKYTNDGSPIVCATLTWAGLILGLSGDPAGASTQDTIVWIKTDTYGREIVEHSGTPSSDWLYRKPFRQLRTFMS